MLGLGALAQAERQPLQRHAADPRGPPGDEQLGERRHHAAGGRAERGVVDRHLAPAEDGEALLLGDLLDPTAGLGDLVGVTRQERGADGVRPGRGEVEVDDVAQEGVGDLEQDARPVTGVDLGAGGAAVVEVAERRERLRHDVVAGLARQRGHHRDAAGVLLVARVVEPLRCREARRELVCRGHWFSRRRLRHRETRSGWDHDWRGVGGSAGDDVGPSTTEPITGESRRAAPFQAVGPAVSRLSALSLGLVVGLVVCLVVGLVTGGVVGRGVRRVVGVGLTRPDDLVAPRVAARRPRVERGGEHEQHDRGPHVEAQAQHVVHLDVVDAQVLDPAPPGGVEHDVERGDATVAQLEPAVEPDQQRERREVPQALVEERRVEQDVGPELRAHAVVERRVDLQAPRAGRWGGRRAPG